MNTTHTARALPTLPAVMGRPEESEPLRPLWQRPLTPLADRPAILSIADWTEAVKEEAAAGCKTWDHIRDTAGEATGNYGWVPRSPLEYHGHFYTSNEVKALDAAWGDLSHYNTTLAAYSRAACDQFDAWVGVHDETQGAHWAWRYYAVSLAVRGVWSSKQPHGVDPEWQRWREAMQVTDWSPEHMAWKAQVLASLGLLGAGASEWVKKGRALGIDDNHAGGEMLAATVWVATHWIAISEAAEFLLATPAWTERTNAEEAERTGRNSITDDFPGEEIPDLPDEAAA